MTNILIWGLLIIPWIILPVRVVTEQVRTPKASLFDIICLGVIVCAITKGVRFYYANKYLGWLVIWCFVSIVFNFYAPYTVKGTMTLTFIEPYIHFILGLWASMCAMSFFDKNDFVRIAKTICWSSVVVTCFSMLQLTPFDPVGIAGQYMALEHNHFVGLMGHYHIVGIYLGLSVPYFFNFLNDRKYIAGLIITLIGVYLSKSDIAIVTTLISLFILFVLKYRNNKRLLIILTIIIMLVSSLFIYKHWGDIKSLDILSRRQMTWEKTLPYIKENPLFGKGFGIFKSYDIKDGPCTALEAHNDWLERICEIGFLGAFLMVLVVINSLRRFNYNKDNSVGFCYYASFIGFVLVMLGSFPFELGQLALMGLVSFWGIERL